MNRKGWVSICSAVTVGVAILAGCAKSHNKPVVKTVTDTCTTVYIAKENDSVLVCLPTAFTPNGDGKNDIYAPIGYYVDSFSNFQMSVYASDTLVYQSTNIHAGWDGTDLNKKKCTGYRYDVRVNIKYPNGTTMANCTYVYLIPTDPINGCIQKVNADTTLYKFADQYDGRSGTVVYPTQEIYCP